MRPRQFATMLVRSMSMVSLLWRKAQGSLEWVTAPLGSLSWLALAQGAVVAEG